MVTVKEFLEFVKKLSNQDDIDDIMLDFRMNIRMVPKDIEDKPSYIPQEINAYSFHNYQVIFDIDGEMTKIATIQLLDN